MEELYNKYRPKTYEELLGNDLAVKSVKSEIANGSHVFLFTGPGGTGKTTLARLISKQLGADDLTVHEMNSAETRGIDSAREIMEQVKYAPMNGKNEVWIMDEFHAQTNAAQQSFLKVLEECPSYVYFFLCTTNPEKLIKPLVTRCSVVNLKPLDDDTMIRLLRTVAHKEQKVMDVKLFSTIAEQAQGSSRKALKILASVLYLQTDDERKQYLETNGVSEDNPDAIMLCRVLLHGAEWKQIAECLAKIDMSEPEGIRQLVMSYMNSVIIKGNYNANAVAALQAFSNCSTFNNGKYAITVACLDTMDMQHQN